MSQTPYSGFQPAGEQKAEVTARRRRSKRKQARVRLSKGQLIVLGVLLLTAFAALAADIVYSAKLSDIEAKHAQEQAELERRVWRTTVKNRDLITKYAAEYAVHPAYIAAIILNESSYDPDALSSVGARGLMQLLPSTGEWIAPKIGISAGTYNDDMLYDEDINVHMGTWYISYLSKKYDGDPILIACAYHAGAGNVTGWIEKYSSDGKHLTYDQIPYDNTRSYARKVVNSYAIYLTYYYPDERTDSVSDAS